MENYLEKKVITFIYENIINKGKYPDFGSPEVKCNKCMFYKIICPPSDIRVGCYGGWKKELE